MAEKKRILYIVEAMGGGVFTYIVDLANELVNKYDMYIAYAVRKQTPKNYKDYFDKRIHLIEVKNFGRAINPTKDIAAFFEVKKIAAEVKPDVIHLHSSKAGAIGRVAFDGKIPMFYTPHGYSFLMENCNPTKRRVFKLIESVCAKRNCTTLSCSVGEHQETLKLTKNAAYVNNGINMEELQEIVDQTEKVTHPFTVFTLGRICYQKNPTLFNTIAESLPDVRFVWIGDGELWEELKSKNIEISGWVDRITAIKYAVNADVFLLPSRWEGLPISLLESMYMRKVCVVSNVIGKALKYNEMARSIEEELFAEYSITRMRSLNTKALVVWEQGKHQDADDIFEYIITTSEQMSSDYLPDVADFLFNYARCLHDQDEDEKAKAQYLKCINIWSEMSEDGNRKLALAHQEIADIFFSENNAADALEHYVLAEKFNAEDFYVEVDVLDSVAACLLLLDKPEEGIQKFKELLEILVKYKANDTEAKFQLCNNLFCIIDAESEEEIELREMLMEQIKDEPATVEYVHNFLTNREEK